MPGQFVTEVATDEAACPGYEDSHDHTTAVGGSVATIVW